MRIQLRMALVGCFLVLAGIVLAQTASIEGEYVLAREKSDEIPAAIAKSTAAMNFFARPIARSRLAKTNPLYERVRIAQTSSGIELILGTNTPMRMPADGSSVRWMRADGEVLDIAARTQPSQIVQTLKAKDGKRTNTFTLGPDSQTLTLQVEVTSERLPEAVRYSLMYRRSGASD